METFLLLIQFRADVHRETSGHAELCFLKEIAASGLSMAAPSLFSLGNAHKDLHPTRLQYLHSICTNLECGLPAALCPF
ncbi:hypothetical protein [Noviherbaspirillum aerium]|uniref:hypothetical protein n=1 Tax=Noviherbaspirillum aerium TaxID=2588497 RepID=UPI00124C678B|nr:hypothetical protein [Noviherbaspirillum aerium]